MYSRVYDKVMQGLEEKGPLVQWLYGLAYANQSWCKAQGFSNPLWDLLVFNRYGIARKDSRPGGSVVCGGCRVCWKQAGRQRGACNSSFRAGSLADGSACMSSDASGALCHTLSVGVGYRIKQALGGKVRLMATGAAPLSKEVHEFLQVRSAGSLPVSWSRGGPGPMVPASLSSVSVDFISRLSLLASRARHVAV